MSGQAGEFTANDDRACKEALGTRPTGTDPQAMMRAIEHTPNLEEIAERHNVIHVELVSKLRGASIVELKLLKDRLDLL